MKLFLSALAVIVSTSSSQAMTWYLHDFKYSDGSVATGSFDWDGTNYSNVSITVSGGTVFPNTKYTIVSPSISVPLRLGAFMNNTPLGNPVWQGRWKEVPVNQHRIRVFSAVQTCTGLIGTTDCGRLSSPYIATADGVRPFISPTLSPVPLPASGLLLVGGLMGLLGFRRFKAR